MRKITGFPLQDTGVGFYRIVQPLRFVKREKLANEIRITPFSGTNDPTKIASYQSLKIPTYNDKLLMRISGGADVIWTTMIFDELQIRRMLDLRKWSGAKWIVDIDDNMFDVTKDNPGYKGVKAASDNIRLCLSLADGLTVSVPYLEKLYKPYNKNIHIIYNGIDMKEWGYTRAKGSKIKIGWRGAYGHSQDFGLAAPALEKLMDRYDIEVHTFGVKPRFNKPFTHTEWVELPEYPKTLAGLGFDIAIVPLIDSNYNRCKSNLAVLENSALKTPVIASPTENQKDLPILYADSNYEWYEKLEQLILDAKLRKSQGEKQFKFIQEKYNPKDQVYPLIEWMEKLPRRTDIEPD
jgi:hypothetical protein